MVLSPPAGGDEHLDPGHPERQRRPLWCSEQPPRHASVWARSDAARHSHTDHRVESWEAREGQREGEGETLQSVQEETVERSAARRARHTLVKRLWNQTFSFFTLLFLIYRPLLENQRTGTWFRVHLTSDSSQSSLTSCNLTRAVCFVQKKTAKPRPVTSSAQVSPVWTVR